VRAFCSDAWRSGADARRAAVAALGGFKRERTPFVLTKGMAFAMGGKGSEEYRRFVDLCCSAFNFIRLHGEELVTLFRLMVPAGMPELTCDEDIQYLVDQLHLGKSDEEASKIFQGEINAAIADVYRRVDNLLHTLKHS
jgi:phosphatidylinositol kinase/protein kinase (PI-3  family)